MVAADYNFVPKGRLSLEQLLSDKSDVVGVEMFKRTLVNNSSRSKKQKVKRRKKKRVKVATKHKKKRIVKSSKQKKARRKS